MLENNTQGECLNLRERRNFGMEKRSTKNCMIYILHVVLGLFVKKNP
jgi:hypothetical protein